MLVPRDFAEPVNLKEFSRFAEFYELLDVLSYAFPFIHPLKIAYYVFVSQLFIHSYLFLLGLKYLSCLHLLLPGQPRKQCDEDCEMVYSSSC